MNREDLIKKIESSGKENMDNFIPMNAAWRCAKCQKQISRTTTCKVYPNGIPKEILMGRELCKERVPK